MLCCILIALLAPLGVFLASWRRRSGTPDCCRTSVPWLMISSLALGAVLLCAMLAYAVLRVQPAMFKDWPICTVFGLQNARQN